MSVDIVKGCRPPNTRRVLVYQQQQIMNEQAIRVVVARMDNPYDTGTTTMRHVEVLSTDAMGAPTWNEIMDRCPTRAFELLCACLYGKHKEEKPVVVHDWALMPYHRYRITANNILGFRLETEGRDLMHEPRWWSCEGLLRPGDVHDDGTGAYRHACYHLLELLMAREGTTPEWWRKR
jgi:hypothetical protein